MIVLTVNTGSASVKLAAFQADGDGASSSSPRSRRAAGSERGRLAVELYCYRAGKYVGAYLAVLGGCDGIALGGGGGEHVPGVRARILSSLEWAGIGLDRAANEAARGRESRISKTGGTVAVWVIPVEEELLMVHAALTVAKIV